MIDEWKVAHKDYDLPQEVYDFVKEKGFFSFIIPKEYGGLDFSPLGLIYVMAKVGSRSGTLASMVGVPNSLGPAELLMHYGTDEQKKELLPKLASGEHVPCFALTGPYAGSDATAMPDTGIVCNGEKILVKCQAKPFHHRLLCFEEACHTEIGRASCRERV